MLNVIKNRIIRKLIRRTNIDVGVIYEILFKVSPTEMKHYCDSYYNSKGYQIDKEENENA